MIWEFLKENNFLCLEMGGWDALKAFEPILEQKVACSQVQSGPGREGQKHRCKGREVQEIASESFGSISMKTHQKEQEELKLTWCRIRSPVKLAALHTHFLHRQVSVLRH